MTLHDPDGGKMAQIVVLLVFGSTTGYALLNIITSL
jgi:hypothetical protein